MYPQITMMRAANNHDENKITMIPSIDTVHKTRKGENITIHKDIIVNMSDLPRKVVADSCAEPIKQAVQPHPEEYDEVDGCLAGPYANKRIDKATAFHQRQQHINQDNSDTLLDSGLGESYVSPPNSTELYTPQQTSYNSGDLSSRLQNIHLNQREQTNQVTDDLTAAQTETFFDENLPTNLPNANVTCHLIEPAKDNVSVPHVVFEVPQISQKQRNIYSQDGDWDTQLHIAIAQGLTRITYEMIEETPSFEYINIRNKLGQSHLIVAALTKQPDVVRKLLSWGADPGLVDRNGNSPLHHACEVQDLRTVYQLTNPLTLKETEMVPYNFPKYEMDVNTRNYEGYTPVHIASSVNCISIVEYLAAVGANMNAPDGKSGRTALHHAVEAGNFEMCMTLLKGGAFVDSKAYDGSTPLKLAYAVKHPQIIDLLIQRGANKEYAMYESDSQSDDDEMDGSYDDFQMAGQPLN
ncbi:unnamed protein product [Owenia fusiformis]|uniref:Uncharacterized protein n=1 Tax=Owenia fusiformis TaxID=6347 RepID=A0A8J1XXP2_OWEFU|nr:unnamed protein product [Owenia fusiformis]